MTQIYLLSFLTGLCFGSFASVIVYRLHSGQKGLLTGRSKCPKCKHILGPKDLVPVFSFLFSAFRCQHCRKPISFIYPLLELTMGLGFLITTYWVGIESAWKLPYFLFLTFIFVTISFYDILFQEIRDSLVRIEDQVKKTNGRVTFLEMWRENTLGRFTVISIFIGVGITTFTAWLTGHLR